MNLAWGELWLLETAVHTWIPLRFLVYPELDQLFNKPGHHLELHELVDALERLLERGDVVLRTDALGPLRPSREALLAALVYTKGRRPLDALHYGLTPQGGARWEQAASADWSRYVQDSFALANDDDDDVADPRCEITGMDRARVEVKLAAFRREVLPGTLTWDRLEPWSVKPWKTLPGAHRVRFRCGPERPPALHEPPRLEAERCRAPCTRSPSKGRRGLLRVLATLPCDAEHADPYHFAIACETGDGELPVNLARVVRRFLGLTHESWNGGLLCEWTAGAPPESLRFEGAVEVTPESARWRSACSGPRRGAGSPGCSCVSGGGGTTGPSTTACELVRKTRRNSRGHGGRRRSSLRSRSERGRPFGERLRCEVGSSPSSHPSRPSCSRPGRSTSAWIAGASTSRSRCAGCWPPIAAQGAASPPRPA